MPFKSKEQREGFFGSLNSNKKVNTLKLPESVVVDKQNKDVEISQLYEKLHEVTKEQDIINLRLIKLIDDMDDPRWIPMHIIDNANAIILGISERRGNPKGIVRNGGYVWEKINSLKVKWETLRYKYMD